MAYTPKTWVDDEVIEKESLNNMEQGIQAVDAKTTELDGKVLTLEGKAVGATTAKEGFVKQAELVPEASAEQVTKEEFKALLDSLKTAGIMSSV